MIKRFKSGKLKLSVPKNYDTISEKFYGTMFRNKLYIDTINGKFYLIDLETCKIYDFNSYILDDLARNKISYLYPAPNSKVLFALYMKEHSAE